MATIPSPWLCKLANCQLASAWWKGEAWERLQLLDSDETKSWTMRHAETTRAISGTAWANLMLRSSWSSWEVSKIATYRHMSHMLIFGQLVFVSWCHPMVVRCCESHCIHVLVSKLLPCLACQVVLVLQRFDVCSIPELLCWSFSNAKMGVGCLCTMRWKETLSFTQRTSSAPVPESVMTCDWPCHFCRE